MFDLSQLRCFVAVAEELHFGRAAARLNMTQPPLSRQIQILERILDAALLDRTSRTVRLTPAGRSFLPEAQHILRLADSAAAATKRIASGKGGTIKMGFTAASAYSFLPQLILHCRSQLPDVDIVLEEMVTHEQLNALTSGRIDVGLVRPPVIQPGLNCRSVAIEALVMALPCNHRLSQSEIIGLREVDTEPFIMYAPYEARYFHDLLVTQFNKAGVQPRYVQYLAQIHSILALVRAGLGLALVPASAGSLHYDGVVLRPARISPAKPVELHLAWQEKGDNPVLPGFLAAVESLVLA
jgi:DNA-binding transcriptional LysR family regulator